MFLLRGWIQFTLRAKLFGMSTTYRVSDEWIGATIKGVAALKGVSLGELAAALDMQQTTLSNKIHGRSTWSAVQIVMVADRLGVEVTQLLDGYDGAVPFPGRLVTAGTNRTHTHQYCGIRRVTVARPHLTKAHFALAA